MPSSREELKARPRRRLPASEECCGVRPPHLCAHGPSPRGASVPSFPGMCRQEASRSHQLQTARLIPWNPAGWGRPVPTAPCHPSSNLLRPQQVAQELILLPRQSEFRPVCNVNHLSKAWFTGVAVVRRVTTYGCTSCGLRSGSTLLPRGCPPGPRHSGRSGLLRLPLNRQPHREQQEGPGMARGGAPQTELANGPRHMARERPAPGSPGQVPRLPWPLGTSGKGRPDTTYLTGGIYQMSLGSLLCATPFSVKKNGI